MINKFFRSILIGLWTLTSLTSYADEFKELKKKTSAEVHQCTYLKGNQICQMGESKPKCIDKPNPHYLITARIYRHGGRACVERETVQVSGNKRTREFRHKCGSDTIEFFGELGDILCRPWDSCHNCESSMRIGN